MTGLAERLRASLAHGYRVERELGAGGMATVYLAHDQRHERPVALKVLRPELAAALGVERFLQEIAILARLVHPNILPLLDSGEADGLPYFVMPYVAGESLRDLLDRQKQLPIDDAVAIARDVAGALAYAHAQGIVHRDIKPENILLESGRAVVADFGIARAVTQSAPAEKLTRTGVSIGTPAYMSPEQAGAEAEIDGRSDIYALGCVLYEMLAGQAPFAGPSVQSILARHQLDAVPPLRTVRRTVPEALERAVMRALEKVPADRYPSAARFADALAAAATDTAAAPRPGLRRAAWATSLVAVIGFAAWAMSKVGFGTGRGSEPALDTSRVAIIALDESGALTASPEAEQLLNDAIKRWEGITVADRFQVRGALTRRGTPGPVSAETMRRAAEQTGSGRYVRLELSRAGDSTRAHAGLYDTRGENRIALKDTTARVAPDLHGADSAFFALADALLQREGRTDTRTGRSPGTRSLPARQAFVQGQLAIEAWDLPAADSAFSASTRFDGDYAEAHLWLSLARWWANRAPPSWASSAERAGAGGGRMAARDRTLARALELLRQGKTVQACGALESLARVNRYDFSAWYALATCLRRDDAVIHDGRSASGWRFRSSRHAALQAYRQAFLLLPSMHRSFRNDATMRSVLLVRSNQVISGRALPPDTTTFRAYAAVNGDTLTFVPFPTWEVVEARGYTRPASTDEAIRRQRSVFHDVAAAWAAEFPNSVAAIEALALSLELLGSPASLDTLDRARSLARGTPDHDRLAAASVWLRLKFALPSDTAGILAARRLADSLRGRRPAASTDADLLASIAAVAGHATRAASILLGQDARSADHGAIGNALVAYAALGGPADSLAALEARASRAIAALDPNMQRDARERWLARAADLAFPHQRLQWWSRGETGSSPVAAAIVAFVAGDTSAVRRELDRLRLARAGIGPGGVNVDALYPEAWLLAQLRDNTVAAQWLDATLTALPATAPQAFHDPARAGTLVHAMALRAELAAAQGDAAAARRWARAVSLLWRDADEFLRPTVRRMDAFGR